MITAEVARLTAPQELVWEREKLDPQALRAGQILGETVCSAISPGTEVAAFEGLPPLRPGPVYPRLVGYCNVARVVATGPEVDKPRVGDLVITQQSHRSAFICRDTEVLAVLDPEHDPVAVSVTYLFHLGYAALLKSGFRQGMNVGVIGLGPIGLATLALVNDGGGAAVGFSNQSAVSGLAAACGARYLLRKDATSVPPLPGGGGLDIVITTSNAWDDWRLALTLARTGGTVGVLGFPGRGEPHPSFNPLASEYFYDKQLSLVACGAVPECDASPADVRFTLRRNMGWLADRVGRGLLPARSLISEMAAPKDLESLYRRFAQRETGLATVVLNW